VRDRDKDWRELLWTTIAPGLRKHPDTIILKNQRDNAIDDIGRSRATAGPKSPTSPTSQVGGQPIPLYSQRKLIFNFYPNRTQIQSFGNNDNNNTTNIYVQAVSSEVEGRKVFLDGVLINKLLILRQGRRFGQNGMIVSVYGMGIAGRVVVRQSRFPR